MPDVGLSCDQRSLPVINLALKNLAGLPALDLSQIVRVLCCQDTYCVVFLQGITIADPNMPDCPLMYVNEAFCRMTGYDQDEILGRNCRFLQGPETDKAALARIKVAMQQVRHVQPTCKGVPAYTLEHTMQVLHGSEGSLASLACRES